MSAALAAALLASGVARGAERPKLPSIAVPEIKASGTMDAKAATGLSSLVASEASRFPVRVVAGSDLQSLLGLERQKQLLGCTEGSCLTEIGGALGVKYLLASEVAQFGDRWILSMTLLDVPRAAPLARASRMAGSPAELLEAVGPTVAEVLKALPVSGVQGEATARPATSPKTSGGRVAGYTLLGVGGALLAGGGVVGVVSWKQYHDTKTTLATTAVKDLDSRKRAIQTETRVADILYAVGGVAAGVGLVLALVSPPSSSPAPPSTTVGFSTLPGGGALTVAGGF